MAALYRAFDDIKAGKRGIALGIFDGVHLGHQQLIGRLRQASVARGLIPSALTFSYPDGLGFDGKPLGQVFLMTEEERVQALFDQGLEDVFLIPLSPDFCHLTPLEFLDQIIRDKMGGEILALGRDARFGWKNEGDVAFLEDYARKQPLTPLILGDVDWGGDKVSSSRIRQALARGLVEDAHAMMTRPFRLTGQVIPGKKLGSKLGFPTANFPYPDHASRLLPGVYMTRVHWQGRAWPAVTSLGVAPSVPRQDRGVLVESYLYDFSDNLYGQSIQVEFLSFIREEETFASLAELKDQIQADLDKVRVLHGL